MDIAGYREVLGFGARDLHRPAPRPILGI